MKKTLFNIGLAMSVALAFSSCYDDKGNYDYISLDQVTISTDGLDIEDEYAIERGDLLSIAPDVYFNGAKNDENAPLDYCWTLYNTATGAGVDMSIDTLGTERELNAPVNRPGATYSVLLTVTNRKDKTQAYKSFSCKVIDNIPAGWMVLYEPNEAPGMTDLGLVCNTLNTKNYTKNKTFWGLFSGINGGPAEGEPRNVYHNCMPLPTGMPYFATSKGIYGVHQLTFEKVFSHETMFEFVTPEMNVNYMAFGGTQNPNVVLLNADGVYQCATAMNGSPSGFSVPKQGVVVGKLANWASPHCTGLDAVVYDQENHRFMCAPRGQVRFDNFDAQDEALTQFDVNNCDGMILEFSDWGANKYDCFLFSKGEERYIAVANFNRAQKASKNIGLTLKNVSTSPEIKNACAFAVNSQGEYCYYAAGNKIYNLAYNSGKDATLAWTAPSEDEVVTCIKTQKIYFDAGARMMINANGLIHIATWNEKTKEGKLYEYKIVPTSGVINTEGEMYEYVVPGKVKDMNYKFVLG